MNRSLLCSVFVYSASILLLPGAESAPELIEQGNVYYDRLQASDALKYYLPAEKLDPTNERLLVRISREYRHLLSDASKPEEKLRLGRTAIDYARRAEALAPNDPDAHLAVGISYGKILPYISSKERFDSSRTVKQEVDKVLATEPGNDLAWHLLGRWRFGLAELGPVKRALAEVAYGKLPAATYEEAAACFKKAIELKPDRLMHYIELGRADWMIGKYDEARKYITKGLSMKDTEKDDPETKRQGREILAKLR